MKKVIIGILAFTFLAASFTSCRSAKPSCAAYDQIQIDEEVK